jgi:hypothetical protein
MKGVEPNHETQTPPLPRARFERRLFCTLIRRFAIFILGFRDFLSKLRAP